MKKILSTFLLILIVFSFSGCSKFSNNAYSVAYDILSEPRNLDPQTASDQASLNVINNIFEGLFYIDEFGGLQNGLAKSVIKSPDGLRLTIDLIDNAVWTNEEEITADDFVFALQRLLNPDTNSPAASQFFCIKNAKEVNSGAAHADSLGVKATSKKQLVIELAYENDNLEYLLATTYAMPCNRIFFNETKGKYGLQSDKIMSNGPFDIKKWEHNESVTLKKSQTYYNKAEVKPASVTLYIKAEGERSQRLLDKKIDAALVSGNNVSGLLKKGFNTEAIESETWGLYLNNKNKYLSNKSIRNAISSCFDRTSYQAELQPNLFVATAIIPNSIMLFDKTFREYSSDIVTRAYDSKNAYKLYLQGLSELGYDEFPVLELLINKDSGIDSAKYFSFPSQVLQRELSVFININEVDEAEYNKRLVSGEFDMAVYKLNSADNMLNSILSRFQSESKYNYISYNSKEYDSLLYTVGTKTKKAEIISEYVNIEKLLAEDDVFIPMYFSTDYFVTAGTTTGIVRNKRTGLISFKEAVIK